MCHLFNCPQSVTLSLDIQKVDPPQEPRDKTQLTMAGGHLKYRHLSRDSAHRQALLRNLVTSLITHESIQTTWHKAKEAQRLAEKLITLAKKDTNASRLRAEQILFTPLRHVNKLFGELKQRYMNRPGGYTRVLHIEPINRHHDQAPSAILELVDGPRDMRFAMTARSLVRERAAAAEDESKGIRDITARNIMKVSRYRTDGEAGLLQEVERLELEEAKQSRSLRDEHQAARNDYEKRLQTYKKEKQVWDAKSPRARRKMEEPEEPEKVDEENYERRPRLEGWEPYGEYRAEERALRKEGFEKDTQKRKEEKRKARQQSQ